MLQQFNHRCSWTACFDMLCHFNIVPGLNILLYYFLQFSLSRTNPDLIKQVAQCKWTQSPMVTVGKSNMKLVIFHRINSWTYHKIFFHTDVQDFCRNHPWHLQMFCMLMLCWCFPILWEYWVIFHFELSWHRFLSYMCVNYMQDIARKMYHLLLFNTLRPKQNGLHFSNDKSKCIFMNENVWILNKKLLKYVSKGPD